MFLFTYATTILGSMMRRRPNAARDEVEQKKRKVRAPLKSSPVKSKSTRDASYYSNKDRAAVGAHLQAPVRSSLLITAKAI